MSEAVLEQERTVSEINDPAERARLLQEGLHGLIGGVALSDEQKRTYWQGVIGAFDEQTPSFDLSLRGRRRGSFGEQDIVPFFASGGELGFQLNLRNLNGEIEETIQLSDSRSGTPAFEIEATSEAEPEIKPIFSAQELEVAFSLSEKAGEYEGRPLFGFAFESQLAPDADQELLEYRDTLAYLDALESPALLGYESGEIDEYGHARSVCIWSDMSEARRLSASEAHQSAAALANSETYDSSKIQRFLVYPSPDGNHRIEMLGEKILTQREVLVG